MPRIFSESGFEVTVTDPPYPNYSNKEDLRIYDQYPDIDALITIGKYTKLWLNEHGISFPSTGTILKRNLLWYSLLRSSPLIVRKGIYLDGGWCAPDLSQRITTNLDSYSVLEYLPLLTEVTSEEVNTSLVMVNNTTHEYVFFQAPEYRPVLVTTKFGASPFKKETSYHTNIAAMKRLGEWIDFLKAEKVYDNTRIVFVADHGSQINYVTNVGLPFPVENYNPLLMVKDFNASGALQTDTTFMTNADVPSIALQGLFDNPRNPFTGEVINTEAKKQPQYIAISGSIHLGDPMETRFGLNPKLDYYVHDNIFDIKNWEKAEK
jgi:hypothetical protein